MIVPRRKTNSTDHPWELLKRYYSPYKGSWRTTNLRTVSWKPKWPLRLRKPVMNYTPQTIILNKVRWARIPKFWIPSFFSKKSSFNPPTSSGNLWPRDTSHPHPATSRERSRRATQNDAVWVKAGDIIQFQKAWPDVSQWKTQGGPTKRHQTKRKS